MILSFKVWMIYLKDLNVQKVETKPWEINYALLMGWMLPGDFLLLLIAMIFMGETSLKELLNFYQVCFMG